jgi:hypothetical protein
MAYIGKKPEDAFRGLAYYDTFTGDGSTTTFDLSADAPDGGQNDITVVVDNVRQEPGASKSYTLGLDGSSRYRRVTFNTAPDNLSEIYVINPGRSTQLNTVSDNAITTAKILDDAVTTAKIGPAAITAPLMGPAAVGASNITPGAITTTQISPSAAITNAQLANSSITINGNAVSLGGSITAGTDWQAVTVADGSTTLNAVAGKGYFLDTNTGVIEVFLPTSPVRGDTVVLADYSGTFATNKVIVNTGGALIDSTVGSEVQLTTNNIIAEFVYTDSAKGWLVKLNQAAGTTPSSALLLGNVYDTDGEFISATGGTITTSGDFKIHTFTGDGCFVVSTGFGPKAKVSYLVVAGGGGGGFDVGGGGGAGGFREGYNCIQCCHTVSPLVAPSLEITPATYPITVGGGGQAGTGGGGSRSGCGSNSVFSTITSTGGGAAYSLSGTPDSLAKTGGSGGGGGRGTSGAAGNTPPVSPPQGNAGGDSSNPDNFAGGGGGATQAGFGPNPSVGGAGAGTNINSATGESGPGPLRYYAGGGGGSRTSAAPLPVREGGIGGGGDGGLGGSPATAGGDGTANTGGGGGGGSGNVPSSGGAGGKGIVIIKYKFQN